MAFAVKATLQAMLSHLQKAGRFPVAQIGDFKQPPGQGSKIAASVYMTSATVRLVYAGGDTQEVHVVTVRLYRDMLAEPQADIETDMAAAVSDLMSDLIGEYDLGGTVRNIDVGGEAGTPLGATWGYVDIGGKMHRIVDLVVPLIVDGSATAAP